MYYYEPNTDVIVEENDSTNSKESYEPPQSALIILGYPLKTMIIMAGVVLLLLGLCIGIGIGTKSFVYFLLAFLPSTAIALLVWFIWLKNMK